MLSCFDYVRQSLETHLFFARIMKEHAFFLQIGFTPRDRKYAQHAEKLRACFDELLSDVISISDGVVSEDLLKSGEAATQFTLEAEKVTEFYTGVPINRKLTEAVLGLGCGRDRNDRVLEQRVTIINRKAIKLLNDIIAFKSNILKNVLECRMYTVNYPLLIEHIMREARLYQHIIRRLQSRKEVDLQREALEQEAFWNQIMAEHSKFIRGLLDPTEEELIKTAHNFGKEFDQLIKEARDAMDMANCDSYRVTEESLRATKNIRDFKAQGTEGLLDCQIRSIIIPLLGDHTLREANHFIRLLKIYSRYS